MMRKCEMNLTIWSGKADDKLQAEWDAAVYLGTPTLLVVVGMGTVVPESMENHPIVRRVIRVEREMTKEDRSYLKSVLSEELDKLERERDREDKEDQAFNDYVYGDGGN